MARPKRRVATREVRWMKRLKTWQNERSTSSSHEEDSDGPSSETSGPSTESCERQKTWLAEELEEEGDLSDDFSAEIVSPSSQEEEVTEVLKSVVGKAENLSTENEFAETGSVQELDDGQVESATGSGQRFYCTACGKDIFSVRELQQHPHLGVGICRSCKKFLFSSPFTKDIDGSEEQCRWCGQGGKIVMCDKCDKVFCETCIVRNYGPIDLHRIVNSNWSCFFCNPQPLSEPINELKEFLDAVASTRLPGNRSDASLPAISITSWDAINIPGIDDESATIAELLALEEERRKQNKSNWTTKEKSASRKRKAAIESKHTDAKVNIPAEAKQREDIEKQASGVLPSKTYLRPHQIKEKRLQAAAARRKRAEEAAAERLKSVSELLADDLQKKKHDDNSDTTQQKPEHPIDISCHDVKLSHLGEETGKQMESSSDEVDNEGKVEKILSFSEDSDQDFHTTAGVFDKTQRNLLANFTGDNEQAIKTTIETEAVREQTSAETTEQLGLEQGEIKYKEMHACE